MQGRVALGPNSGAAVERFGRDVGDLRPRSSPGELCCEVDGFSLQAKVLIAADDREGLERVCRYVTRPPIKLERLSLAPDGKVIYALRRRWRDGTSLNRVRAARFPHPGSRRSFLGPERTCRRITVSWHHQPPGASSSCRALRVRRTALKARLARRTASATEL